MRGLTASKPTALDLFCGVGGLSLGVQQAGFRLLGGVDSDQIVLDTHKANFPKVPTHLCDLFKVSGEELRLGLGLGNQVIDLIAGGPPCQGFSIGGRQIAKDPRNHGVMAFAKLITDLKPRYFLMENVRGFLFKDHDQLRRRYCRLLKSAGYKMQDFQILNAADFGVPQRRNRAFIIGCLSEEILPEYPNSAKYPRPSVRDAISDLVAVDKSDTSHNEDVYVGKLEEPSKYAEALRLGPKKLLASLTGCLRTLHSDDVIRRFSNTPAGEQEPISRFFRLSWEGISPTIRAGTGPDHGSHTAPRPIHPEWPRCITVREAARLHSFPDAFVFRGTRWHGFRQVGNSVPPLLAKAVASEMQLAMRG